MADCAMEGTAEVRRPVPARAGNNRPGPIRRIRLFGLFAWLGLVEYLRSALMILMNLTFPWFMLLLLLPFAIGAGPGNAPEVRISRIAEGPDDAADTRLRAAFREIEWLHSRRHTEEKARHAFDNGMLDAMGVLQPAPQDAGTNAPPVVEIQVRNPDDPIWPVLEARLESPAPSLSEPRPILLAPVALRDDGPRPAPYAGFFTILLAFTMMGVAVQVLTDRTDNWTPFLRVAPVSPALALSGLAGGRLLISLISITYQWYVIDWTIGWPAAMSMPAVLLALGLGFALALILGTAYALALPSWHGAKDSAPQAVWLLVLGLPLFWSPGDIAWAQALALANPLMPLLDLLRAGFGAEPMLLAPPAAGAFASAWILAGLLLLTWAGRRAFRPGRRS